MHLRWGAFYTEWNGYYPPGSAFRWAWTEQRLLGTLKMLGNRSSLWWIFLFVDFSVQYFSRFQYFFLQVVIELKVSLLASLYLPRFVAMLLPLFPTRHESQPGVRIWPGLWQRVAGRVGEDPKSFKYDLTDWIIILLSSSRAVFIDIIIIIIALLGKKFIRKAKKNVLFTVVFSCKKFIMDPFFSLLFRFQ